MLKKIRSKLSFSDLAKGSSVAFGLRIFGMLVGYIFTLMISNYYGAEALGVYSLSFVFLQMIATFGRLGIDMTSVKFIADYNIKNENNFIKKFYYMVVKFVFPFSILVSLIAIYLSPYIAKYVFNKEYLSEYFQLISLAIVPYIFIFIHSESLRGLHKIKEYMFLQNISTTLIAFILLLVAIFYTMEALYVPIFVLVVAIYLTFFTSIWLWKKELSNVYNNVKKVLLGNEKDGLTYKKIFSVALPLTLTSYLAIIMGSTDIVMIAMFMTEKDVGIYSIVIKLSTISLIVFMAVNTITVSKFAAYWGKNKLLEMQNLSNESTKLILYFSLPIFLIIWIFPTEILGMFGKAFEEGVSALIIMTVGQFLFIIAGPIWQMMNMTNKQKIFFYFSLMSAIINVVLNYILIPIHGIEGAAYATVAGGIVLNLISILYIKLKFNILTLYIPFYKY